MNCENEQNRYVNEIKSRLEAREYLITQPFVPEDIFSRAVYWYFYDNNLVTIVSNKEDITISISEQIDLESIAHEIVEEYRHMFERQHE